ncbi:MAG: flagellar FliJ family protein [Actinobacteria bacterium]|nr:flagellar FliJ family protein [Actinomycetota bacterium]
MNGQRGDVVVKVRTIQEEIAVAAAAIANGVAEAANAAASRARSRAATHPLSGSSGSLAAADLMTAVGVGSALRETALTARRRASLAAQARDEARQVATRASAQRKAAERLTRKRAAAAEYEQGRRDQRLLDENAAGALPPR